MKLVETETIYDFEDKDPVAADFRRSLTYHKQEKWSHVIILGKAPSGSPVMISSMHDCDIVHMLEAAKISLFRR